MNAVWLCVSIIAFCVGFALGHFMGWCSGIERAKNLPREWWGQR